MPFCNKRIIIQINRVPYQKLENSLKKEGAYVLDTHI